LASQLESRPEGLHRIDRSSAPAKNGDRFFAKAVREKNRERRYSDPFSEIQDQVAIRATVFYLMDVEAIEAVVRKYFDRIQVSSVAEDLPKSSASKAAT
jgi:putative GTP pyrophosphokinase